MTNGAKRRPAVVGALGLNGLGVVRALHEQGIPAIAVTEPRWHHSMATRLARVERAAAWEEGAFIAKLLEVGQHLDAPAPLILTADDCVRWASRHRDALGKYYLIRLPDADLLEMLLSKAAFQEFAQQQGWRVPRSWDIESRADLESKEPVLVYPAIIKPRSKNDAFQRFAPTKAYVCDDFANLRKKYDIIANWEKEVVIQEFIPGADDHIVFCLDYLGSEAQPLGRFVGKKLWQYPVGCGNTAAAQPLRGDLAEAVSAQTQRIWSRVGMVGLGSVEYKLKPGTNELVIMEPTAGRTNKQSEVAVMNGCNLVAIAYCDALGIELPRCHDSKREVIYVDGPSLFFSVRDTTQSWLQAIVITVKTWFRPSRYAIWRWYDPAPMFASLPPFALRVARKIGRSLRGTS
jgi:D-aspartate ligase